MFGETESAPLAWLAGWLVECTSCFASQIYVAVSILLCMYINKVLDDAVIMW